VQERLIEKEIITKAEVKEIFNEVL
jgi:hypothetical protein